MSRGLESFQVNEYLTRKIIQNLEIECASNTQVVIAIATAAGADDGSVVMEAAADITLDITTSGVNGLDTGSEAPNTWYYIYMIRNPSNGLVRGLLSTSSTAPVMPAGYTQKRLVGAVRNNGSSDFRQFSQVDKAVQYRREFIVVSAVSTVTTWTAIDASSVLPHDLARILKGTAAAELTNKTSHRINVRPGTQAGAGAGDGIQIVQLQQPLPNLADAFVPCEFFVDESQIFSWYSNIGGQNANIICNGFKIEF